MNELIEKYKKTVVTAMRQLIRLGGLVCLYIQKVTHAKAVNSNFRIQMPTEEAAVLSGRNLSSLRSPSAKEEEADCAMDSGFAK